jgi:hypothetical protein
MMIERPSWRQMLQDFRHGEWSCGFEFYKNKPMFSFEVGFYDWYIYAWHIGPFWVCCM